MIPDNLTFASPGRLVVLLLVAALAAGYVWQQRRRRGYEQRFADPGLVDGVMPRRPGWRRHLPASLMILTMAALTTGFARPAADVKVPRENATVVVALDTSGSMRATDVSPDRLDAAKAAAAQFVQDLPKTFAVGLVAFNSTTSISATPTLDHAAVVNAINNLQLGGVRRSATPCRPASWLPRLRRRQPPPRRPRSPPPQRRCTSCCCPTAATPSGARSPTASPPPRSPATP